MNFLEEDWDFRFELPRRDAPEDAEKAAKNRAILLGAYDALASGDIESFWAIFDPDVVFHEASSLPYGGAHRGLAAVREAVGSMSAAYSKMHTAFEAILFGGDIALAYQTIDFRVKANGNSGSLPVAELYRFRDGKVIEWRALYFDPNVVAQAIAGAGTS
jgi:ketosteroid isomerase-like protein